VRDAAGIMSIVFVRFHVTSAKTTRVYYLCSVYRHSTRHPRCDILDCLLRLYWTGLTLLNGFSFLVIFRIFFYFLGGRAVD